MRNKGPSAPADGLLLAGKHSIDKLMILRTFAAVTTVLAAALVAANWNARLTVADFVIFMIASIAWMADGWFGARPGKSPGGERLIRHQASPRVLMRSAKSVSCTALECGNERTRRCAGGSSFLERRQPRGAFLQYLQQMRNCYRL